MIDRRDARRVLDLTDETRDEIVELERALVRFDSVNQPPWGNEGPCQAFVAERMRDLGLRVDCFTPEEVPGIAQDPAFLHGRDYTDRPNVVGTLAGSGGGRSLHLAAHVDVVPIEKPGQWIVEPFGAQVIEGKIYGRGAVDDKDGIAAMLDALQVIQKAGYHLRGDLILSSYVDKEFAGGNGLLAVVRKGVSRRCSDQLRRSGVPALGGQHWRWPLPGADSEPGGSRPSHPIYAPRPCGLQGGPISAQPAMAGTLAAPSLPGGHAIDPLRQDPGSSHHGLV